MGEGQPTVGIRRRLDVIIRIGDFVSGGAVAEFEKDNIGLRAIKHLVRHALRRKSGAHAGTQLRLPPVGEKRRFAFEDINEFVLPAVSMKERGTRRRDAAASG